MRKHRRYVFDASAVIALANRESGHERVESMLPGASISAVNLAEVASKLHENGLDLAKVAEWMAALGIQVIPFDSLLAYRTGELRNPTRSVGLSLGDRACLATAAHLGLPVLTADKAWSRLKIGIDIQVIR